LLRPAQFQKSDKPTIRQLMLESDDFQQTPAAPPLDGLRRVDVNVEGHGDPMEYKQSALDDRTGPKEVREPGQ
jgi:hypothetical protein